MKNNIITRRKLLLGSAALVIAPTAARALGIASAIRLHDHGTHTRLVLELSEPVDFGIFRLAEPYRMVVDLPELDWAIQPGAAPGAVGLVTGVRFGLFQAGTGRVVVELAGPAAVKGAFVLPATAETPCRFVLDLETATREAFMVHVGPQFRSGSGQFAGAAPAAKPNIPAAKSPSVAKTKPTILIDPGHGGIDPGAIGLSGIYEKTITLAAARQLKARFEAAGKYKVLLTRDRDVSLGLAERRDIAYGAEADLFISLHADSIKDRSVRGLSVYTLSDKASDREAADLAEQENSADRIIGMDLSRETQEVRHILVDLAQRESMNLATKLAGNLIGELKREAPLLHNGHRYARFAVLKSPDIPSVLIEMGYLSNREDEKALKLEAYRAKLMAAVVRGVEAHLSAVQTARRG